MNFYDEFGIVKAQPNIPDFFQEIEGFDDAGYLQCWADAIYAFQRLMKHLENGGSQAKTIAHCLLDLNGMGAGGFNLNEFKELEIDAYVNCRALIDFNNLLKVPLQDAFEDGEEWFEMIRKNCGGKRSNFTTWPK